MQQDRDRLWRIDPFVAVRDEVDADRDPGDRAGLVDPGTSSTAANMKTSGSHPLPMETWRSPIDTVRRV